jgi:hypothetical protein
MQQILGLRVRCFSLQSQLRGFQYSLGAEAWRRFEAQLQSGVDEITVESEQQYWAAMVDLLQRALAHLESLFSDHVEECEIAGMMAQVVL